MKKKTEKTERTPKKGEISKKPKGEAGSEVRDEPFDEKKTYSFKVDVVLSPGNKVPLEFKSAGKKNFLYDDLLDSADAAIENKFPREFFPKADLDHMSLMILDDGKWYHVFPKSEFEKGRKAFPREKKILVLDEATYSISDEYRLYLSMAENGLIDPDSTQFDADSMRNVLEGIKGKKKTPSR